MIDINYKGYLIKLKETHDEWLAAVRDGGNNTITSEWHPTKEVAEEWAKNVIENINSSEE